MNENRNVTAELWDPILEILRNVGVSLAVLLVIFIGIQMLAVYAFGANFDIQRWIDRIKAGKQARRILFSTLAIISGIAAEMHFSPYLLLAPAQAGPGVLAGLVAIIAGSAILLTGNTSTPRTSTPRRMVLSLTAIVTTVLVGGCAIGNALGEAV